MQLASQGCIKPHPQERGLKNDDQEDYTIDIRISMTTLSRENLDTLFNFTFHLDMENEEGTSSGEKRMKLQFTGEVLRNEATCASFHKMLTDQRFIIDFGILDDSPPSYSPFNRSMADLYMFHECYFKHGVVLSGG